MRRDIAGLKLLQRGGVPVRGECPAELARKLRRGRTGLSGKRESCDRAFLKRAFLKRAFLKKAFLKRSIAHGERSGQKEGRVKRGGGPWHVQDPPRSGTPLADFRLAVYLLCSERHRAQSHWGRIC